MAKRKFRMFMCDFETTTYEGIEKTEVWASACVELFTEDVKVFHSIDELFEFFFDTGENIRCWFHNLKFDGSFVLDYFLIELGFTQAIESVNVDGKQSERFMSAKDMPNKTIAYVISEMGQWYTIRIKYCNKIIEIRDSLKLLPFSVKQIGKGFKTKRQKLDIEYEGFRYAGCEITPQEEEYIKNDVLVVSEALEQMFTRGFTKLTIGSCCLDQFKKFTFFEEDDYLKTFPDLTQIALEKTAFGSDNADAYIRKSYKGGWCYVVKGKANQVKTKGLTADVNSLYPSMMSSESGNYYPVGQPTFWRGNYIPEEAKQKYKYYFVRIRTRFDIKEGYLPFVQIKGSYWYQGNECLETSDIYNSKTDRFCNAFIGSDNKEHDARVTLTLTMTDFELLKEHYHLTDFQILDGCYFDSTIGLFDDYIEKYKKQKIEAKTPTDKQIAKLMLNNLYGKLASSTDSSFKVAYVKDDLSLGFRSVIAHDKKTMFIACGSAITSYARNFTIRTAQKNYHGVNERGFIYADTDSIHCDLQPDELIDVPVHDKNFCHWKLESYWDVGIFARQKTYIEHITHEDSEPVKKPYYNIKCAGMPERCKNILMKSINKDYSDLEKYTENERKFIETEHTIEDFKVGLVVNGKLMPKRIRGGVVLVSTTFEIH